MKWITRERVKVDRVACPWLIKRFIDRDAEFYFVPADQVVREAARLGAIPFELAGLDLGRGEACSTFETILVKYRLTNNPALVLMGRIVSDADFDTTPAAQPEGPGLEAIAEGFCFLGFRTDREQVEAELIVYDALYAWCQQQVKK